MLELVCWKKKAHVCLFAYWFLPKNQITHTRKREHNNQSQFMNISNCITFQDCQFLEAEWTDRKLSPFQLIAHPTGASDKKSAKQQTTNSYQPLSTESNRNNFYFDESPDSTHLISQVSDGGSNIDEHHNSETTATKATTATNQKHNELRAKPFRQLIQVWSCHVPHKGLKLVDRITKSNLVKKSLMAVSHMNRFATVQPRFIHGIHSLQFSIDLISIEMMNNDTVSYALLAEQAGRLYLCHRALFPLSNSSNSGSGSNNGWKRFVTRDITSRDFSQLVDQAEIMHRIVVDTNSEQDSNDMNSEYNSSGSNSSDDEHSKDGDTIVVNQISTPIDFSSNGHAIRFGYITISETKRAKSQAITGLDNFTLSVKAGYAGDAIDSGDGIGDEESSKFNLCTLFEGQHKKILELSDQVYRSYKQQTSDREQIEDLKKKLKMLEGCYHQLRASKTTSTTTSTDDHVQLRTIEGGGNSAVDSEEHDDFVQITIEPPKTLRKSNNTTTTTLAKPHPHVTSSALSSTTVSSSNDETTREKIRARDYDFPTDELFDISNNNQLSDSQVNESDLTDFDADTDVIFPESDSSLPPILPSRLPSLKELLPNPVPIVVVDDKQPEPTAATSSAQIPTVVLSSSKALTVQSSVSKATTTKQPNKMPVVNDANLQPKYFQQVDDIEDDWEIMDNTTTKFTVDKIIKPNNEI